MFATNHDIVEERITSLLEQRNRIDALIDYHESVKALIDISVDVMIEKCSQLVDVWLANRTELYVYDISVCPEDTDFRKAILNTLLGKNEVCRYTEGT